jgi:hypothetical protein
MHRPDGRHVPLAAATLAAWLVFLVLDFLAHAVVLAAWWRATESYWLPPMELFRRIPFGYGAFALLVGTMTWLLVRLRGPQPIVRDALRFGALAGLLAGAGSVMGAYSILPMPASTLVVWTVSTVVESAGAATAAAWTLRAPRPWRRVLLVFALTIALFVIGVVLQNVVFPTPANRLAWCADGLIRA